MDDKSDSKEETFQMDGLSMTSSEAEVLYVHYLEMCGTLFELLPGDYEIPAGRFSDALAKAVNAFHLTLEKEYQEMGEEIDYVARLDKDNNYQSNESE